MPTLRALLLLAILLAVPAAPRTAAATNRWDREIAAFVAADQRNPPRPGGVLFYGSSSFRVWTNLVRAFPGRSVVNRGFGGSHLSDLIVHAGTVVVPHAPRLVFVYGGDNDLAAGKPVAVVERDFRALAGLLHRALPATRIAFVAIKPSPSRLRWLPAQAEANRRIRSWAWWCPEVDYLDAASPLLDDQGAPDPRCFQSDRLHLNEEGYRRWTEVFRAYLDRRAPLASR